MRTRRGAALLVLVLVLVLGLGVVLLGRQGSDGEPSVEVAGPDPEQEAPPLVRLSARGLGPVWLGMRGDEAEATGLLTLPNPVPAGRRPVRAEIDLPHARACWDPATDRITAIWVGPGSPVRTTTSIGTESTITEVKAAYAAPVRRVAGDPGFWWVRVGGRNAHVFVPTVAQGARTGAGAGMSIGLLGRARLTSVLADRVTACGQRCGDSCERPAPAPGTLEVPPVQPTALDAVRPDGIGPLVFGMSRAQVEATGVATVVEPTWVEPFWRVDFQEPVGSGCYTPDTFYGVLVKSPAPTRTPEGIGVRSSVAELTAAYGNRLERRSRDDGRGSGAVWYVLLEDHGGMAFFPQGKDQLIILAGLRDFVDASLPNTGVCMDRSETPPTLSTGGLDPLRWGMSRAALMEIGGVLVSREPPPTWHRWSVDVFGYGRLRGCATPGHGLYELTVRFPSRVRVEPGITDVTTVQDLRAMFGEGLERRRDQGHVWYVVLEGTGGYAILPGGDGTVDLVLAGPRAYVERFVAADVSCQWG